MREDLRKTPIYDKKLALEIARILQHMTGDPCAAQFNTANSFLLVRRTPEGKHDRG